jgi:phosphoglycolate phosphatase
MKGINVDVKIKTVIFDLDGTLLDTLEDLTDATNFSLRQYGMEQKSIEQVKSYVGNGIRRLVERAVPSGEDNPHFMDVFNTFKSYYNEHCNDKTRAYEGIPELLERLKAKGVSVAIVSNKADFAVKQLRDIYFGDIEVAIGESEGVRKKPAPDTINMALEALGTDRKGAVYVGDSEVDIETALNADMPCISVLWGFRDKDFLVQRGASVFAETPSDVLGLIGLN